MMALHDPAQEPGAAMGPPDAEMADLAVREAAKGEGIDLAADRYITLAQAARILGYGKDGAANLRRFALSGRLRTVKFHDQLRMTTPAWLREFEESKDPRKGGRPRTKPPGFVRPSDP